MQSSYSRSERLIEKLQSLPEANQAEVEDFVDFLYQRNESRYLVKAAKAVSEPTFREIWDNPEDSIYDKL